MVDAYTKSILLLKPNQDFRFDSIIEIPVKDGRFHYSEKLEHPEAVTLMFGEAKESGGGRYMPLFLENDSIELTLFSEEEFDKNTVVGGELNAEYKKYQHLSSRGAFLFVERPSAMVLNSGWSFPFVEKPGATILSSGWSSSLIDCFRSWTKEQPYPGLEELGWIIST